MCALARNDMFIYNIERKCPPMRRILALLFSLTFLTLPVRAAETKYAALTFDDGPSGRFTRQLLDGLKDRGVEATFLLCGYRLANYPDLAQRMVEEGHEIGFHGFSHRNMKNMSRREVASEVMDTEALLPEGCRPVFLRPPGGFSSDAVQQVAEARNLSILHWSLDPRDWEVKDARTVEKAVLANIQDGDIVLLHDMSQSSVDAALNIVDALLRKNFQLVTVSELARIRGMNLKPGQEYSSFPKKEEEVK